MSLQKKVSFQFQTGSIRRLSKNYINIILHPYSSCQVNFYFDQIRGQFAVDLQSRKFSGRLTALCVKRVYRQYYAKFGKLSGTKLVNFRRSTADRLNRFCVYAFLSGFSGIAKTAMVAIQNTIRIVKNLIFISISPME